jgi:Protein of unknown function (DUF1236)
MKPVSISLVSAAILAAASFGANAQQQQKEENAPSVNRSAPAGESGGQKAGEPKPDQPQGGQKTQGREQPKGGDRAQMNEKPGQQGAGEKPGDMNKAGRTDDRSKDAARGDKQDGDGKSANQQPKQDADNKSADQQKQGGDNKSADQQKQGGNDKSADQNRSGDRQSTKVVIKPEQKTVIKETIVKERIKPERINVQVRVGVAIPRTVVLHALPPTIVEVYPSYSRYKLVMIDDNTILIVDPDTWEIVDVIEV